MRYLAYLALCLLLAACTNQNSPTDQLSSSGEATPSLQTTTSDYQRSIAPPLAGVAVPFESQQLAASQPATITFEDGTTFRIPADAFVDAAGNTYTGTVSLQYRDFRTPAEVLASGIPMDVTLADGSLGQMQTAGMFEVRATATDGSPLDVAPDKRIGVDMPSGVAGGDYDFWAYDEASNNWDNRQTDVTASPNPERAKAEQLLDAPAPAVVRPAAKFDKRKPIVDLNIDTDRFPDLKQLDGVFWQYAGDDPARDPNRQEWVFTEDWNTADLTPGERANTYDVKLESDEKSFETVLVPSKSTPELESQIAAYEERHAEYKANMMSRAEAQAYVDKQTAFVRSMELSGMGIYNYDRILKEEDHVQILADFEFEEAIPDLYDLVQVYLVTGDSRMLVKLPPSSWDFFSFSPSMDNRLLAILPGNRVAVFTQEDFNREMATLKASRQRKYTFKMRTLPYQVASVSDLSRIVRQIS